MAIGVLIGFTLFVLATLVWTITRTPGARAAEASMGKHPHPASSDTAAHPRGCHSARKAVKFYVGRVAFWRDQMGAGRERGLVPLASCPQYLAHVLQHKAYKMRAAYSRLQAKRRAYFRRLYEQWRCIHEHEGAWDANTGNGYYGGLQMTTWFQQHYGSEFWRRWGTADKWPVWAQLTAAERARQSDGDYGQWGTAHTCGLPT